MRGLKIHSFIHFSHLRIAQLLTLIFLRIVSTSVTMPYKISSTNFANLRYAGEYFHGEIFRIGRYLSIDRELDFPTLSKK